VIGCFILVYHRNNDIFSVFSAHCFVVVLALRPLSIIKGYNEMLLEFIPDEKLETDKLIELLLSSQGQIERLEIFVDMMKQLSGLEERKLIRGKVSIEFLYKQIDESLNIYADSSYPEFELTITDSGISAFYGDMVLIMEVIDNIISNAVRFAAKKIKIYISARDDFLRVDISDDGAGFGENLEYAAKAYYHNNPKGSTGHFGLGLYLSKQLCELHGGGLELFNLEEGGASVAANFLIK